VAFPCHLKVDCAFEGDHALPFGANLPHFPADALHLHSRAETHSSPRLHHALPGKLLGVLEKKQLDAPVI
jgi:hypothetical protein